jgi:pimeloyl-ACP methyl ester carboxylesterase
VVLSHGFPESSRSWHAQIQAVAEAGYMEVGPDLRGYGGSSKPPLIKDYALMKSFAVLLLTGTALGDRFGRRRMFAYGIGLTQDLERHCDEPRVC